jgi:hypothetical protein
MDLKKGLHSERSLAMHKEKKTSPPLPYRGRSMSSIDLTYEEHAAIYSAAIVLVFRAGKVFFPRLAVTLPELVYRRLMIYSAGLCALRKYQTCLGISRQLGGCSHDALNRLLQNGAFTASTLMMACFQTAISLCSGVRLPCWLIIDDVILSKATSRKMAAAYWDYDYVHEKNIRCLRVVMLCWSNGFFKIPVAFALWHKKGCAYLEQTNTKFRTKNQLARLLVYSLMRRGLPFDFLLFDSWYAAGQQLAWYHGRGIHFVTAVKNNRTLYLPSISLDKRPTRPRKTTVRWDGKSPSELVAPYPNSRDYHYYGDIRCRTRRFPVILPDLDLFCTLVCIKNYAHNPAFKEQVSKARKKQKDPNQYLLTNAIDLTIVEIVTWYRRRWDIEVLFRDCKQHLGLNACQAQQVSAHVHHIACVLFSHVLMDQMKAIAAKADLQAHTLTIGQVKEWLNRQYLLLGPQKQTAQLSLMDLSVFSEADLIDCLDQIQALSETEPAGNASLQPYQFVKLRNAA